MPQSLPFQSIDFRLRMSNGTVVYWGLRHSFHEADTTLRDLAEAARNYAQQATFLVEGVPNLHPQNVPSQIAKAKQDFFSLHPSQLIEQLGERGVVMNLAREFDRPIYSPEPTTEALVSELRNQGFQLQHIVAYSALLGLSSQYANANQSVAAAGLRAMITSEVRRVSAAYCGETIPADGFLYLQSELPEIEWAGLTLENAHNLLSGPEAADVPFDFTPLAQAHANIRNTSVASAAIDCLDQSEVVFIAFGASHTVGILSCLASFTDVYL